MPSYSPEGDEAKTLKKWLDRYELAKAFKKPVQDKHLRMFYLFHGYDYRTNYPYPIRRMPSIGFRIIETFVSRLAPAKREVQVIPRMPDDIESPSLAKWDDLLHYYFDITRLDKEIRSDAIQDSGIYGNGLVKCIWAGDVPGIYLCDLWDILPAPEATSMSTCPWMIHRIIKKHDVLMQQEKERGENSIYKNLEYVEPMKIDDWKKDRHQIETKMMGQIDTNYEQTKNKLGDTKRGEMYKDADCVEILECWDWESDPQQLVVIMNGQVLTREVENPYSFLKSSNGRIFFDLPDHNISHSMWAKGHLEPVESAILELADGRNHRATVSEYTLDPVVKIRKDTGINRDDIKFEPMAIWELRKLDDVEVVRPTDVSLMSRDIEEDIKSEIEQTLAMTEYLTGQPQSATEAMGKVEALIGQSNQRLTINTDNLSSFYTDMCNCLIEMTQEFMEEEIAYRILGDEGIEFGMFSLADKEVQVDARIEVEPVIPPDKKARIQGLMFLLETMVAGDPPDPQNPEEMAIWKTRKRLIYEMLLQELDKGQYVKQFLGSRENEEAPVLPAGSGQDTAMTAQQLPKQLPEKIPMIPQQGGGGQPQAQGNNSKLRQLMQKIPLLNKLA